MWVLLGFGLIWIGALFLYKQWALYGTLLRIVASMFYVYLSSITVFRGSLWLAFSLPALYGQKGLYLSNSMFNLAIWVLPVIIPGYILLAMLWTPITAVRADETQSLLLCPDCGWSRNVTLCAAAPATRGNG